MKQNSSIPAIAECLRKSERILFITGAGISAESGLPTYRGVSGLYNDQDTEDGMPVETALSGTMMERRPEITWKYIAQIENACRGKQFNKGHEVIATMEKHFPGVCVLTQNIDGFHHDAGSENIIDIHGDIHKIHCTKCDFRDWVTDYEKLEIPPTCEKCGSLIRPEVVLFGEMLPTDKLQHLESELRQGFDMVFTIGTTSVFPYIAQPVLMARRSGIPTVEINPGETEVSSLVEYKLESGAGEALEAIWGEFLKDS